jgi:flagellar hook-associated protein FlgK
MNAFPIGTSAIATGQRGLDIIGQNLANAATPGYHRQGLNLVNRVTGDTMGAGVDVASLTRYTADPVRAAIISGNSDQGLFDTRVSIRRQIEVTLGSGEGGIGDKLGSFFNQLEQLTSTPDSGAARRPLIATASDLARQFNTSATDIDKLRSDIGQQVPRVVTEVNDLASKIADYNVRIQAREKLGEQANDLRDQRDQFVDELSKRMDVQIVNQPFGVVNVLTNGAAVVLNEFAGKFQSGLDTSGNMVVTEVGSTQPIGIRSGSLGGLLQEYNTDIPATRARLDALAGELVRRVNAVQATGVGLGGPITSAAGTVSATSSTAALNASNLPFPVQAGSLTVSVTDPAGNRTNTTINIDPSVDSIQSIATALGGIPGLTTSIDSPSNRLNIQAQAGYSFDFAGRDTNPPGGGAVANPDSAGILTALGLNGFFSGTDAVSISVRPELAADPNLLAASSSGQPGDATNLERMAAVRDAAAIGGRTLTEDYADQASSVGTDVKRLGDLQTAQTSLMNNLFGEEQSVTGVDSNEELVHLLDFQRMIEGASRYLSVVNSSLDEIMNIIR